MIRTSLPKTSAFTRHLRRQLCSSRSLAADHVRIVEVAPRDGLQNEKSIISLDTKIELVERLAKTGITHMEAGSFVAAKWVPQVGLTQYACQSIMFLDAAFVGKSAKAVRWLRRQKSVGASYLVRQMRLILLRIITLCPMYVGLRPWFPSSINISHHPNREMVIRFRLPPANIQTRGPWKVPS